MLSAIFTAHVPAQAQLQAQPHATTQSESIRYYQGRYELPDVYTKRVDNRGEGFEPLYGVRNFRAVLNGVVYRGGANNAFNRNGVRHNSNPLPNEGLENLCQEGFGRAVYLYSTRYETAPKTTSCRSLSGQDSQLDYAQRSPLNSEKHAHEILRLVHKTLTGGDARPIYLHCWNGWHASGYISTLVLRQFCGLTGDQGVAYWDRNTDGHNKDARYESIRKRIRAYQPDATMKISASLRAKVCPRIR